MKLFKSKNIAFTLAEVLITLGIIGVVAAITIPGLITKYHKTVAESKLKKFYSTMNQAVKMSIADHDDFDFMDVSDVTTSANAAKITDWYNEYILKYLTGIQTIDTGEGLNQNYIKIILNDGTGFVSYMQFQGNEKQTLWLFYCLNAMDKSCKPESYDGKNTFLFAFNTEQNQFDTGWYSVSMSTAKASCYKTNDTTRHGCSQLIKLNGWKIPDDYPWYK